MVVVGVLVGTFEPALVMVTIAHTNNASAAKNTVAPSPAAGASAGMNGKGMNQLSPSPASTASAHAIGGRKRTWAVSGSVIAGTRDLGRRSWRAAWRRPSVRLSPPSWPLWSPYPSGLGALRHLVAYGSANKYRPVNSSRKSGSNGE